VKTIYACGEPPAAPPVTLTRTIQELPGTACPAGGTRVEAGPDLDDDAVLDDLEVRTTSLVCGAGPVRANGRHRHELCVAEHGVVAHDEPRPPARDGRAPAARAGSYRVAMAGADAAGPHRHALKISTTDLAT
jgi:hypothetical protein